MINEPSLRALFKISTVGVPPVEYGDYTQTLLNFTNRCLTFKTSERPTCEELLKVCVLLSKDCTNIIQDPFLLEACTREEFQRFMEIASKHIDQ